MAKDFKNALKKMEQEQEAPKEIIKKESKEVKPVNTNKKELSKQDLELLLLDYTNDSQDSSYTLKGTKPLMDLLKGLACKQRLSIKELYIKALCDYIRNSNKEDIEGALEYKEKYLD